VKVDGAEVTAHRPDVSISRGVAYLPPDRKLLGGMMDLSARENLTLSDLAPFWHSLRLRRREETRETSVWFERLQIRPARATEAALTSFSGGNQQKILLAKWLRLSPRVLLVDEPTQGVDVAARTAVHHYLLETARRGAVVIVSSSDAEELTALCDRVLVFRGDSVVAELHGKEITVAAIARDAYGEPAELAS
jgi:ribose transport system ATP-binding protein